MSGPSEFAPSLEPGHVASNVIDQRRDFVVFRCVGPDGGAEPFDQLAQARARHGLLAGLDDQPSP
jgi:hypothetical protein